MATQPHHDDDQSKKKPGDVKKAPVTPKQPIPNFSLEDEEPLPVEELVEEEPVPIAEPTPIESDILMAEPIHEAKPASEVEPLILADDDIIEAVPAASDVFLADEAEEVVEATPASEVVEVEPLADEAVLSDEVLAETPAETPPQEAQPVSDVIEDVVLADEAVEVAGSSTVLADAAPASEPDLMSLLSEASAVTPVEEAVAEPVEAIEEIEPVLEVEPVEAIDEVASESEPDLVSAMETAAVIPEHVDEHHGAPVTELNKLTDEHPVDPQLAASESVAHAPASDVMAAPASEVVAADEHVAAAPLSEVVAAEEHVAQAPASEIVAAQEPMEHVAAPTEQRTPDSAVLAAEPPVEIAAPSSAILADEAVEEVVEAMPDSAVIAEEAVEAMPESAVIAEEVEAMPESAVVAEEAVEAMPESAVVAEEAVEEAAPASGVIFDDEEVAEAMPESAVVAEEVVEIEPSSATRKSEAVLGDELEAAEAVSEVSAVEATEFDGPAVSGKGATKSVDLEQTMAFQPPSSAAKKSDEDELVTAEDLEGSSEASAVDLGDVSSKKGSSVTGIDRLAEALESGVDLGATAPPEPSVEFDEILEDLPESGDDIDLGSVEGPMVGKKTPDKKDKKDKKEKAAAKATGDDIDLDALFGEDEAEEAAEAEEAEAVEDAEGTDELTAEEAEEAAEAAEAEEAEPAEADEAVSFDDAGAEAAEADEAEAAEAEAAEAFDEEVEAAESAEGDELADFADDEEPKAKAKKGKKDDEDEEAEAEAAEDEDEDVSAKKKDKKGKKEKEKATVAAAPAKSGFGCFTVVVAMFLVVLLFGGGLAGVYFGANDQVRDFAKDQWNLDTKQPPRVVPPLERGSEALAKGKYTDAIAALAAASTPEEYNIRGQAKWYQYVDTKKDQLDKDSPEAKAAIEDLEKGKNKVLADQIRQHDPMREKGFTDQIATLKKDKETVETDLAKVTKEKDDTDKKIDSLADILAKSKVIEDKSKLDNATVQKVLQALNSDKTTLDTVNKLLKDAEIKGLGDEGVKEIIKLRTELDKNLAAVDKILEDEKAKDKGAKGVLEIVDARNKMTKDRDDLTKIVGEAFKEFIDGKIVPDNADPRKSLVEGAKLARQKAESPLSIPLAQLGMALGGVGSGTNKAVQQTFDLSRVFSELGFFRTREPFIQTPEEKMNTHMALLANRKKKDAKELAAITREADWVLSKESKADDEARNKARFVQGLALRNEEKFDAARAAFQETLKKMQPLEKAPAWAKSVNHANLEISDATVYYIPRIDVFRAEHDYKSAFDEANTALKAMPEDARLYALRGLIRLEAVQGQKISGETEKGIRADAAAAAKDEMVAAESAYLIGLLEEQMGNWPVAEQQYRQALKLHQGSSDGAGRYRVSLARLLLRERGAEEVVAPPPMKKIDDGKDEKKLDKKGDDGKDEKKLDKKDDEKKVDKKDEKKLDKKDDGKDEKKLDKKDDGKEEKKLDKKDDGKEEKVGQTMLIHPWSTLVAAVVVAQAGDEVDDKESIARVNETIKIAQELINSKNKKLQGQGYILLGSALSKIGKRTEGLKEYAKGLRMVYPEIETKEIEQLINDHPAFQQPDISGTPNPVMAERHFGEGMHLFWSKEFDKAESQFKTAVKYYDKDARYQYYLGLSQLAQRTKTKRDAAYYSFEVGARLEAKSVSTNPYAARDINMSLERIQGPVRELLNSFRFKALDPEADAKAPNPN